jgi:proteasome lid subunit RPN8/RPN11
MTVELPKKLASEFRKAAKLVFPVESYAILLGKVGGNGVYKVHELYFPPEAPSYSTDDIVNVQDSWWKDARLIARGKKLSLLGDLHSHTYPPAWEPDKTCQPSTADLERFDFLRRKTRLLAPIFGIACIYPSKRGYETVFKFWPVVRNPSLRVTR